MHYKHTLYFRKPSHLVHVSLHKALNCTCKWRRIKSKLWLQHKKSGRRLSVCHPSQWDEQSLGLIRQVCVNSLSMKTNEKEEDSRRCGASFISLFLCLSLWVSLALLSSESLAVNISGEMLSSAGVQVKWPCGCKTTEHCSKLEHKEILNAYCFRELHCLIYDDFFPFKPIIKGLWSL